MQMVDIPWGVASGGIGDGLRCWRLLVLINFGGGRFSAGGGGRFQGEVNLSLVEAAFF